VNSEVSFEWDEEHRQEKIKDRGLDIAALGPEIFKDPNVVVREDRRRDYGEDRFNAFGLVDGLRLCVCFTPRDDCIRLITIFKIHKKRWSRRYEKND
jgi:uncharacterized DUF497 family protein